MSKQAIIAIVVGVLILLGAAGAFLYSQSKPKQPTTVTNNQSTPTPNNAMAGSITDLLSRGETSMCTFEVGGEEGTTKGTVYTSNENARADINTTVDNKETVAHMIRNGDTFYMWGDSLPMGIKMVMSVNDLSSRMQDNESMSNTFDPNKEVDFKCVTWTEDASVFTPPTNVRFTSFGNTAPTGAMNRTSVAPTSASNTTDSSSQCNVCNSLTGAAKSACIAQFNCQ